MSWDWVAAVMKILLDDIGMDEVKTNQRQTEKIIKQRFLQLMKNSNKANKTSVNSKKKPKTPFSFLLKR